MKKKDITIEMIEEAGYMPYPSNDPYKTIWSKPKTWMAGSVEHSHNGKWLRPAESKHGYWDVILMVNGKRYRFAIHRLVAMKYMGIQSDQYVDHINHDKSDSRIENLRIATISQNGGNRLKQRDASSKYKGVSWRMSDKVWQVSIMLNKKAKYLGRFNSEIEAARAYDEAALKHFKDYAYLNFPEESVI